jgi:hypothetical protein
VIACWRRRRRTQIRNLHKQIRNQKDYQRPSHSQILVTTCWRGRNRPPIQTLHNQISLRSHFQHQLQNLGSVTACWKRRGISPVSQLRLLNYRLLADKAHANIPMSTMTFHVQNAGSKTNPLHRHVTDATFRLETLILENPPALPCQKATTTTTTIPLACQKVH